MARRTQHALQRQLKRERTHLQWLEQHLPHSQQLAQCEVRIVTLLQQNVQHSVIRNKKSAATATLFPNLYEQQCCSVHHYNFCEVASGVTIVFAGSVVGAEHAATVRARTKPTTTFFIVCPFITEMIECCALRKRAAP